MGKWFTGFDFGLCIGDFFFFLINTSVLCVWFASVFACLVCFCIGIDLSASQRRHDVMPGASDVMG